MPSDDFDISKLKAHDDQEWIKVGFYIDETLRKGAGHSIPTEDAKDLCQEAFIKAWKGIGKFEWRGFGFKSWLNRITVNVVMDYYRRPEREILRNAQDGDTGEEIPDWLDQVLACQGLIFTPVDPETPDYIKIRTALKILARDSPIHYECLSQWAQKTSLRDIAELIGQPLASTDRLLKRAVISLREIFNKLV